MEHSFLKKQAKPLLILATIVGMVNLFLIYSNFLGNPDNLICGGGLELYQSSHWERSLGRWFLPIFDSMKGGVASPILNTLICVLFFSLGAIVLCALFEGVQKQWSCAIFVLMIVASPVVAVTATYYYCSAAYGFAFFLATIAAWLVHRYKGWRSIAVGVALMTIVLGLYQGYIGTFTSIAVEYVLIQVLLAQKDSKEIFTKFVRFVLVGLIGIVCYYFVVMPIVLNVYGLEMASYKGANDLSILNIILSAPESMRFAYVDFSEYFLGNSIAANPFGINQVSALLLLTAIIVLFIEVVSNKNWQMRTFILVGVCVLPLACNVMDLLNPATRIILLTSGGLITVPSFCFAAIIIGAKRLKHVQIKDIFSLLGMVFGGIIVWLYMLSVNTDGMYMKQLKNINQAITNRICTVLEQNFNQELYGGQKIFIAGIPTHGNYSLELSNLNQKVNAYAKWGDLWAVLPNSLEGWKEMFWQYTGTNLNICTAEEAREVIKTQTFEEMPNYPEDGSIQVVNDIIVVKVSGMDSIRLE